jgi:hypothetical protein
MVRAISSGRCNISGGSAAEPERYIRYKTISLNNLKEI